jgi:DNA-directed RNA polymerase specialized sigma24 family protein
MLINSIFKSKTLTDQEIVEGILGNERERNRSIEALYKQNRGFILKFLEGKSNDMYLVKQPEDILWEAIMAVLNNILDQKYELNSAVPLRGYLTTICKNLWYKNISQEENRDAREQVYSDESDDFQPDVLNDIAHQQKWELYLQVFERAGKNCKQIFSLWLVDGMDNKEIAEVMIREDKMKSEQSVRNAKSDCLKKVAAELKAVN